MFPNFKLLKDPLEMRTPWEIPETPFERPLKTWDNWQALGQVPVPVPVKSKRKGELDLGLWSIRSSPRNGLSTPYRLTIWNSARLFHHGLFNMGDLHLVLPALNLSTLNAGFSIMMQQVRLMMFSLNMVDYSMSFFAGQVGGTTLNLSYSLRFIVGPLLHA